MPAQTTAAENLAFRLNAAPGPVVDYVGALGLRAVFVAVRLGVFRVLASGPRPVAELASTLGLDPRGAETLLDALESVGYVRQQHGGHALTAMAAKWMPRFSDGVDFYEWMASEGWGDLPDRLRGRRVDGHGGQTWVAGDSEEDNFAGMVSTARLAADEVVRRVSFRRAPARLLDVGGGHGVYAARFARRHPTLRATVLDTADVLRRSATVVREEGVADRVQLRPGDFWTDDLGSGYDAVLLFNLINAYPDDRKVRLIERACSALAPGGQLVVLDQMRGSAAGGTARAVVELTNLRLFDPAHGGTYALPELRSWLADRGLCKIRNYRLFSVPWAALVVALRDNTPLAPEATHRSRIDRAETNRKATR